MKFTLPGLTYGCNRCSIFLHKSCAELPPEIQNPFHPHPLNLLAVGPFEPQPFHFEVCLEERRGFIYRCNHCEFDLDVKCAFLTPTIEEGQEQLKHSSHLHPLALIEKNNDDGANCRACSIRCSGPTYGCIPCNLFLHRSCAERQFPQEIQHFLHPCPLSLCTKPDCIWCRACNNNLSGFFYCEQGKFQLDVECTLPPTIKLEGENQIHDLSHGQPPTLCMKKEEDGVYCSACGKCCSGPTYVCERCKFYLQESCIGLPPRDPTPISPTPPSQLGGATPNMHEARCNACCNYVDGCSYYCDECDFNLHVKCTELMPTVEYEGHNHLLTFIEDVGHREVGCIICLRTAPSICFDRLNTS